jgi:hypothetical protein
MMKTLLRLATTLLVSGVMMAAPNPASAAGQLVQITFSGTSTKPPGYRFEGCIQYDSTQSANPPRYFDFSGSNLNHEFCYQTDDNLSGSGVMGSCEPFTIRTSLNANKTFKLEATQPATTSVTVSISAASGVTFGTSLPTCPSGSPVFQAGGTFTLSTEANGTVTFTGTITSVTCMNVPNGTNCQCSPIQAPAPAFPVYYAAAPAPCPEYACQPRPACCLTRLFARLGHRNNCR